MAVLPCPRCGGTAFRFAHIAACRCGWGRVDPPQRRATTATTFDPILDTDADTDDDPDDQGDDESADDCDDFRGDLP